MLFVTQQSLSQAEKVLVRENLRYRTRQLDFKTFHQQAVVNLYFDAASHFYRARDALKASGIELFEDDIRLSDRYLMERFVHGSASFIGVQASSSDLPYQQLHQAKLKSSQYKPNFHVVSLDIECSESGELYSVGLVSQQFTQVIMIGQVQPSENWVCWVTDECHLLRELVKTIQSCDPDIIVGWNIVNFDFRILLERAAVQNVALSLGRDKSAVMWRDARGENNQGFVSIAGRVVIDGIDALKTATYQFDSFSLENVAQQLLGRGKKTADVDNRMAAITHDFIHDKVKLARYNLQDCQLVLDILSNTRLIDYLVLRSQLTGLELDRMGGSVAAFINLYLPRLHRTGYVSPNRPADGGLASPGGYVMNSFPGLYDNVLVLDFKSLYPSIIRTFKIDPLGMVEGLRAPDDAIPGFRGACFSRQQHFLPDIITTLWQQRDEAKKHQDAARSQAIKIIMNSFYGVLGSGGCPFYDTRLASSITLRGHEIMQTTAKLIEQQGYKVIYGDTDSTFVWLENCQDRQAAMAIGDNLATQINQFWQQHLEQQYQLDCHLEIEFETLFEKFLMPTIRGSEAGSKKRYAGLKSDGQGGTELVFKGLENVRSDWTPLAKHFQHRLYQMVFAGEDVTQFIQQTLLDIRAGVEDDNLKYRKRLRQKLSLYSKNVPPHVKAARLADDFLQRTGKPTRYQNKGWITYVVTLDGPQPVENVSSPLDYEHYIEKQIRPIAEGILPFVGVSFSDITSAQLGLF